MKHFYNIVIAFALGVLTCVVAIFKFCHIQVTDANSDQLYKNLNMVNQWLILKMKGMNISSSLREDGVRKIAVYGMGINGRHLVRELCDTDIEIVYALDQKKMPPFMGINIIKPETEIPKVDLIVNSVIYAQAEVCKKIEKISDCPVVSLEDLVFESYQEEG